MKEVKPCQGNCKRHTPHSHDLTWYGRWYFSRLNPKWWFLK